MLHEELHVKSIITIPDTSEGSNDYLIQKQPGYALTDNTISKDALPTLFVNAGLKSQPSVHVFNTYNPYIVNVFHIELSDFNIVIIHVLNR